MTREVPQIEAVKYALRQSKDGTVVSFVIHPEDLDPALQCLPIGARVMLGWYAIGDDEQPVPEAQRKSATKPITARAEPDGIEEVAGSTPAGGVHPKEKDRRPFHQLPLAQQCAMRCGEERFRKFLNNDTGNYETADEVATAMRLYLGIHSRADLAHDHNAANKWRKMESDYQQWLTDQKYEDIRR